ncbi:MAG: hypothetical protein WCJ11_10130 [Methylococcaceae bacterium]
MNRTVLFPTANDDKQGNSLEYQKTAHHFLACNASANDTMGKST